MEELEIAQKNLILGRIIAKSTFQHLLVYEGGHLHKQVCSFHNSSKVGQDFSPLSLQGKK